VVGRCLKWFKFNIYFLKWSLNLQSCRIFQSHSTILKDRNRSVQQNQGLYIPLFGLKQIPLFQFYGIEINEF